MANDPVLQVSDLHVTFQTRGSRAIRAVDGVSLRARPGEEVVLGPRAERSRRLARPRCRSREIRQREPVVFRDRLSRKDSEARQRSAKIRA